MRPFLLLGLLAQFIAGGVAADTLVDCGQVCELDAFGQKLTYPGAVVGKDVFATTLNVATFKDLKGSIIVQTSTTTVNQPPKPTITWEVSGVTLTFPTTYVIYKSFVRSFVVTETAGCSTGSSTLRLGASTDFSSLIYPASEVVSTLPPPALIGYLESIPTVFAQLGGFVNSSCDPTSTTPFVSGPTVTVTTTNVLTGVTIATSTVISVSDEFQTMSGSALTVTLPTPRFRNTTITSALTSAVTSLSTSTGTLLSTLSPLPVTASTTSTTSSSISSSSTTSTTSSSSVSSSSQPPTSTVSTGITSTSSSTSTETTTSTITSSSTLPLATTVTFTGAISTLESSSPGAPPFPANSTTAAPTQAPSASTTTTSSIQLVTTNLANQFADGTYVGTGGFLAGILGLAMYWL